MDTILDKLLALAEKGSVERRSAALLVLGALKLENPRILKTVGAALDESNPVLKDFALRYFEEAGPGNGAPLLLKVLEEPDREMQERAVRLLGRCGQSVVSPLLKQAAAASRAWLLNAARVLCAIRGKTAFRGLLRMLSSGTDEFNKSVCDWMIPAIRGMDAKEQDSLYSEVEAFAAGLDEKRQRPAVVSTVRLLGLLGRPQSRRRLFRFAGPEHPHSLRAHALVALLRCLRDQELHKDEYGRLFSVLQEAEFSELTRLALEVLDMRGLPEDSRPLLSRLLESPHGDVQKFALRKMGDFSTPANVRTLIDQLGDPDYRRRDIAARSLHRIPEARAALIKELLACDDPSKAWSIAELVPTYEGRWRRDHLEALWKRLQAAIAAEDRIQNSFLHVLKQVDADSAYRRLAGHGAGLVKAKKYKEAIPFLTPLKEFSEFKPEDQFQLALARLKVDSHRAAAVDLLRDLYRSSAFPVYEALKKERRLAPEDLFYLGFRLAEGDVSERGLGKSLLEHLAARVPRTKIGKSAKNKLKLLGG